MLKITMFIAWLSHSLIGHLYDLLQDLNPHFFFPLVEYKNKGIIKDRILRGKKNSVFFLMHITRSCLDHFH